MKEGLIALTVDLVNAGETETVAARARRSISTVYYAMFHALAESNADLLVGGLSGGPAWVRVYRALDHRAAKCVLANPRPSLDRGDALDAFASVIVDLQELRHAADYDPIASFDLDAARSVVAAARQALAAFATVPRERRLDLATRLLLKPRP